MCVGKWKVEDMRILEDRNNLFSYGEFSEYDWVKRNYKKA